mgnify:CR=1 FL=1
MRKEFMLGDIPVTMERRKVKNLNLYVQPPEGRVLATIPWRMREADAIKFIRSKENWIRTAREKVRSRQKSAETPGEAALPYTKEEVEKLQKEILRLAAYWEPLMGVHCTGWQLREMKTRWGSCSSKGNLNFNWRLIFAPEEVVDYIVVHELAHRKEMNHSRAFYNVVASVLPDYKVQEKWLKENGEKLWNCV